MPAPNSADASGASEADVRRLESKFATLISAQSSSKVTGAILTLVFAALAIFLVYRVMEPFVGLATDPGQQKQLQDAFTKEVQTTLAPAVEDEARKLAASLMPLIEKEVAKAQNEKLPKLAEAAQLEATKLVDSLTEQTQKMLAGRAEDFQKRYLEIFKKEFPELADPSKAETILKNAELAARGAADRVLKTDLKKHYEAMERISNAFDKIEIPAHVSRMTEDQLGEHIFSLIGELLIERLAVADQVQVPVAAPAEK